MLTHILHNSPALCTLVEQLDLSLSKPQQQHVINLVDSLLVCDGPKTLAALQREYVECADGSTMADTLRIAPWTANDLQEPVGAFLVRAAVAQARAIGKLKYITVSLDDSLAPSTRTRNVWKVSIGMTLISKARPNNRAMPTGSRISRVISALAGSP